ncbi:hypothetical protein CsatA_016160 [Cannabis sativa]
MAILTTFLALVTTLTTNTATVTSVTFSVPTVNSGKFVGIGIVARKITKKLVFFASSSNQFLENYFFGEETGYLVIFLVILLATIPILTTFLTSAITPAIFPTPTTNSATFPAPTSNSRIVVGLGIVTGKITSLITKKLVSSSRNLFLCNFSSDNANSDDFFGAGSNSDNFFGTGGYSDNFFGVDNKLQ